MEAVTQRKAMSVDDQLARDRRLFGESFERVDRDGTRTRLDPSTVTIRRQRTERCRHGVHPLNRCKDCD